MKNQILITGLLLILNSISFAKSNSISDTMATLQPFVGTYKLISQHIQTDPKSDRSGVCYEEIMASAEVGSAQNGCSDCGARFDIFGLPKGQGLIVIQMSNVNQGFKSKPAQNPMSDVSTGYYNFESQVSGSQISSKFGAYDVGGNLIYSTRFQAQMNADILDLKVANFRQINGFEKSTASCKYQKK